ncbi:MAG: Asp-tRNA(Asn)/Glu-tRNA(Gln) amidotransferase subunit GatC [Alicyclobacillus herbarius]|uniref:Asp-tRNA(Asn)/Glu-tRNA(Gln) amidotransferase subunit GatC n=1 Tax=Alicyclobacillus herbarius TaxID=122960 RepID=UPI00235601FA|nr:Asp-tRNA(Asn)/Glu-tRNA(Gln) amidotransferase subunit GatC [Alicyclobacillus herbarius]MCL6633512.1 Asp-tRNA(Asn)/Glu-tRNA(Gln) amidotransferase subunit GatC [Alicyclobacillus herbarius]
MKISEDTVRHVAALARLSLSDREVAHLAPQLSEIIDYAEQLQEVDLSDVKPTSHSLTQTNVFREDEPRPSLAREVALACAPDRTDEYVRVPAVLEG